MKTRIIFTKIWKDEYFSALTNDEKLLFIYLLINENANMCGVYEINDKEIILWTGIKKDKLKEFKTKFEEDNKFIFRNGWVKVVNHAKYNSYGKGEKQELAYKKEYSLIPEDLKENIIEPKNVEYAENYIKNGNSYEHIKIAEVLIGRKLKEDEVVHHIDKNPSNNNPDNLVVLRKKKHIALHRGEITLKDTTPILVSGGYDTTPILDLKHKTEIINDKTENRNPNKGSSKSNGSSTTEEIDIEKVDRELLEEEKKEKLKEEKKKLVESLSWR